ncbi:MAG TPA: hypothetical protein ENI27_06035 [bacterium]|nr:hypothetical protein [bacterium]
MVAPIFIAAGISAGANLIGSYLANKSAKSQRRRDRKSLSDFRDSYLKQSPAELEYAKLLQTRMKEGALPVGQLIQGVSRQVGEFTQQGTAAVSGQFANIGLGGTAASASAVGRVQAKALQAIAEQSRAIQIENELTKVTAGNRYGQYAASRSDVMRRMAEMTLGVETGISASRGASESRYARDITGAIGETASFFGSQQGSYPPILQDGVTYIWDPKTNRYAPAGS